ncbi:MAG: DUF1592 domain-containing protein [Acidobacteria bacterium]|nr:DUF1592 domain-containing protein [Acidobacteriota bacterium]
MQARTGRHDAAVRTVRRTRMMPQSATALAACLWLASGTAAAQSLEADVAPLVEGSCLACHGDRTVTPLNLARLGFDLGDRETYRAWERVHERLEKGEMPPAAARQPEGPVLDAALRSLKRALVDANLAARGPQRTPLRRLTRLEYAYTIEDLLGIDSAVAQALGQTLPAEADSGGFDTVAANQSMSSLHVRAYLDAADRALDAALRTGPAPGARRHVIDYTKSRYLWGIEHARALGLGIVKRVPDAYVMFFDFGSTYTFHSASEGFAVTEPGRYRVTVEAYPYQADTPVTLTVYQGKMAGVAASLDELIGTFDLEAPRAVEMRPYLRPGDLIGLSVADLDVPAEAAGYGPSDPSQGYGGMKDYPGEGIAVRSMTIEGPLPAGDEWPPASTRRLLPGVEFDAAGGIVLTKDPFEHVVDAVAGFARRAFRRPLADGELKAYANLAEPLLADGRPFLEAVRVPLRAILSAPAFLFPGGASEAGGDQAGGDQAGGDQAGSPGGGDARTLDDFALASRLSYFLWRSLPDAPLLRAAADGRLSDPAVLAAHVDRLLDDERSERFVRDFAGQAFRLYELRATTPDAGLYPEYDDRLGQAMARETELFLGALIDENHGIGHLIDADFTFANRRLAEHYDLPGVRGQRMRRVALPAGSPRGGLLTQASVLKVTANGTTTSPVPRGNFVLANLLGQPPAPPPPGIEGLEPDTRGTTTIREQLTAHRANPVCASCHRVIDPPGFALESFDPIGGFRKSYRASGGEATFGEFTVPLPYVDGLPVDPSGVTPEGEAFSGIEDYKDLMLRNDLEQVARHLTAQLLVFSTGAEIEFADRDAVETIVARLGDDDYPIRTMIHEVARSDLFRTR